MRPQAEESGVKLFEANVFSNPLYERRSNQSRFCVLTCAALVKMHWMQLPSEEKIMFSGAVVKAI
jgi:hypothetical protein